MSRTTAEKASHDDVREHAQRGTRQFLIARACVVASSFVASAILTRALGPSNFGVYGVVSSQLMWLEMLMNAGIPSATAQLMADSRHDQAAVESSARALLVGWSLALLATCWIAAPWVADLMRIPNGTVLLRIALLDLPFMAIFVSYDGALNGRRLFGILAAVQVAYGAIKLAGILLLVVLGISVEGALAAYVVSTGVLAAVLAVRYRPFGSRPRAPIVREILAITAPMALYLVSIQVLLSLDLWSLKALWTGPGEVLGHYVASMNLSKMLLVISGAQSGVVFASVAWALAEGNAARARHHIQDATRFGLILATAAWVLLVLNGSEVLSLLYSRPYADGDRFLPLQLAALAILVLLDILEAALMAAGHRWSIAGILLATVPFAWLGNVVLIPLLGPIGAAASLLLGVVIATVTVGIIAYRRFGALVRASTLGRVLVAAAVVGLASTLYPVHGPLVLVKLGVLGVLYFFVLFGLGEVTKDDFRILRGRPVGASA